MENKKPARVLKARSHTSGADGSAAVPAKNAPRTPKTRAPEQDAVSVRALSKSYANAAEELPVLIDIAFSVPVGGSLAIVGESGSGKSTLLNLIGGLDYPSSGSVQVFSRQIEGMNETELAEFRNTHIGFVFQYHHLLPDFSAIENIALPALIAGRRYEDAMADARALLHDIGLHDRAGHRPAQLSGGEQQRVAILRALINKPGLVLMDEPTGNLDEETGKAVLAFARELQRRHNLTLIIVTHSGAVSTACDRCLRLALGRAVMYQQGRQGADRTPARQSKASVAQPSARRQTRIQKT